MTKTLVLVCFMVAFAAGLTVGLESQKRAVLVPPTNHSQHRSSWGLAAELGLDAQQQEKLDKIWSETARQGGRDREDRRRKLYHTRDEAIAALIRPEDKPKYDSIRKEYSDQMEILDREWHASWEAAIDQTRAILTPDQRVKYEEVLKRHQAERGRATGTTANEGASDPPKKLQRRRLSDRGNV